MNEDEKDTFISTILARQIGSSVTWKAPDTPPMLGELYVHEVRVARDILETKISTQRAILQARDLQDLTDEYDELGRTDDPSEVTSWRSVRLGLQDLFKSSPVVLAGLGHPDYWPDYAYWSRMEHYTVKEAVWLAIGLEPRAKWTVDKLISTRSDAYISPFLECADDLQEQINRFVRSTPYNFSSITAGPLLEWVERTGLPIQDGFRQTLATVARRQGSDTAKATTDKPVDKRELAAAQKIIAAMAMDGYGYDPTANRSPIPGQVESACDQAGIPVSRETVLKHLRAGISHLPGEN